MSNPEFVLVVNASRYVNFDSREFSRVCATPLPVYVTVDLDVGGGLNILNLFRGEGSQPTATVLYAGDYEEPPPETASAGSAGTGGSAAALAGPLGDAGRQVLRALGMSPIASIVKPHTVGEFCAAVANPAVGLVWPKMDWWPPGFSGAGVPQVRPNTSGLFNQNGTKKSSGSCPDCNGAGCPNCVYGAYEVLDINSNRIGNLLYIPDTYVPSPPGALQVRTDNFWLPNALPSVFALKAVLQLQAPPGSTVRRTYTAATIVTPPFAEVPPNDLNFWRITYVDDPADNSGIVQGYLRAPTLTTTWQWYALASALSGGLYDIPQNGLMRMKRIASPLTTELNTMWRASTPYVP